MLKLAKIIGSLLAILIMLTGGGPFPFHPSTAADDGGQAEFEGIIPGPFTPPDIESIPKLDSQLNQMVEAQASGRPQVATMEGQGDMPEDQVRVVLECAPGQADAAAQAASEFGVVEASYKDLIQMTVPVTNLTALVDLPGVIRVRQPWHATPAASLNEGIPLTRADKWQTSGYTGAGVKVGILDVGFAGYTTRQSEGELPATINTSWSEGVGVQGTNVHGTACAEVVYDYAPDADIYFAQFDTEVEMGDAVDWLISKDVNIISCSAGFNVGGPGDGTGIIDDMVADARTDGIIWVQAAGNNALSHWSGPFTNNGHEWNVFSGTDVTDPIYASRGDTITAELKWDDPWGTSSNNYDLLLFYDINGDHTLEYSENYSEVVCYSAYPQDGTGGDDYPVEEFSYTANFTGTYYFTIGTTNGSTNTLHLYASTSLYYAVAGNSLFIPADSPDAMTVGAVFWNDPTNIEIFSSLGPTDDGRTKPDLVAPDGVSSSTYGASDGQPWTSHGTGFFGTSASTPATAGAAAIIKQCYSSYTPAEIQSFLEGCAVPLGASGKDNIYGSGRLDLGMKIFTNTATDITTDTVTLNGNLFSLEVYSSANVSFLWGKDADLNDFEETTPETKTVMGAFSAPVDGLDPSTTYYFKAKASSEGETVYGDTVNFTTLKVLSSITVNPDNPTVARGRSQPFTATGTFSDASQVDLTDNVTWSSDNETVATIDAGGLAHCLNEGNAAIKATLGSMSGFTTLTVGAKGLDSLAVTPANATVAKGRSQPFTATGTFSDASQADLTDNVTWSSDNETVATIDTDGLAHCLDEGGATVTATLGSISGFTTLTVGTKELDSLAVTPVNPTVARGRSQPFTATGMYSDKSTVDLTSSVIWISSDNTVAQINADGLVTAYAAGTVNISADYNGHIGNTTLTVLSDTSPRGGGGGGSGGGGSPGTTFLRDVITANGRITAYTTVASDDLRVKLTIKSGTYALNKMGQRLISITITKMQDPPPPPEDAHIIGLAYEFGPSGATFDPSITVTFKYDPADLPEGVNEADLSIAFYDEVTGKWVVLGNITVDIAAHTVSGDLSHFTIFAAIAYPPPPVTTTPVVTAIPPTTTTTSSPVTVATPVTTAPPASFTVSNLSIVPGQVVASEQAVVTATVTNTGGSRGKYTVILTANGAKEAEEEVSLSPGESQVVSFPLTMAVDGTYNIDIAGNAGQLIVTPPPPPETSEPADVTPIQPTIGWGSLAGGIGCIVVIGGILAIVFVRRRNGIKPA
jgi:hypothetical protein